eukprot:TRINITY_DN26159_c0_g1_i6.p1 TRINITY_DN26159_c0_g1~~TRINITY_DN26159_c0_g1_i6.p1  ORF type:complete len:315 (+),score=61.82 TRINITY_DN26159_c0_g1_i6:69-947(+)
MEDGRGNQGNQATHWWAPPKLPRFSGELADGPAEDFTQEAHRVFRAYRMTDAVAADFLIRHLCGKARREVLSCREEEADTPLKVLNILKNIFGDSRPMANLMGQFHGRQQHPGQSVLEFAQGLKTLSGQINSRTANSISEDALRDRFIEGLAPAPLKRELRRQVREGEDVTFNMVKDEALRWMREEDDPQEDSFPAVQQHMLTHNPLPEVLELRSEMASLKEAVKVMQSSLTSLLERPPPDREPTSSHPPTSRADIRCFYCDKPGHMTRVCRKRKGDEEARRNQNQGQKAEN